MQDFGWLNDFGKAEFWIQNLADFKIFESQISEFMIFADWEILVIQDSEFKILADFNILEIAKCQDFSWLQDFGTPNSWIQDFGIPKSWI